MRLNNVLFVTLALSVAGTEPAGTLPFCVFSPAAHPSWTTVNCTVPSGQKLDILEGSLPDTTTELVVSGAEAVMFGPNSLSRLKDIRHLRVSDSKLILMRKFAALNLNVVSVYLQIDNCDVLRIEEKTFSNIKGPLSVTIRDCDNVSIEGDAFSWLLTMKIANVLKLELSKEAFMLDPTAANVGEHGPGLTIELKNLVIPELGVQTFGSSAASISMESVAVRAIRAGAFTANTYNIVAAVNCTFHIIEGESFAQKSLINNFQLHGCRVHRLASKALQSAIAHLNISHSRFEYIETGAINATVAAIVITNSEFNNFMERGFEISSWNKFQMERNVFDEVAPNAIVAPGTSIHDMSFVENEIETAHAGSFGFIGQAYASSPHSVLYKRNYFGQPCHCNISSWLSKVLDTNSEDLYEYESLCTVNEFFARCFNVPEQNMLFKKFLDGVCGEESTIQCERFESNATEIKNPRFPHKNKDDEEEGLTGRNKKVIGIVIVTVFGCILVALIISLIRWLKRKGYCFKLKNFLFSTNSSCRSICDRMCSCGANNGLDNARSISQLSVNEYSERHHLNGPRVQEAVLETALPDMYTEPEVPTDDKTTQTLPEELTKELLENLKEKLENPEHYVEAREMIEHLYELIKVEESCGNTASKRDEENIYELPFQNTCPRVGKNKKQMISVGTKTPSIEHLLPLSPYNRQTALAHEYFEPKDFAVHLYAEIANCNNKEKKTLFGNMPDVVAEQAVPRGPYLRAKMNTDASVSPLNKFSGSSASPNSMSTIASNKSSRSNASGKMINRPLPQKPLEHGDSTVSRHG